MVVMIVALLSELASVLNALQHRHLRVPPVDVLKFLVYTMDVNYRLHQRAKDIFRNTSRFEFYDHLTSHPDKVVVANPSGDGFYEQWGDLSVAVRRSVALWDGWKPLLPLEQSFKLSVDRSWGASDLFRNCLSTSNTACDP